MESIQDRLKNLRQRIMDECIDAALRNELGPDWLRKLYDYAECAKKKQVPDISEIEILNHRDFLKTVKKNHGIGIVNHEIIDVTYGTFLIDVCPFTKDHLKWIAPYSESFRINRNDNMHDPNISSEYLTFSSNWATISAIERLIPLLVKAMPDYPDTDPDAMEEDWKLELSGIILSQIKETDDAKKNLSAGSKEQNRFREITAMQDYKEFVFKVLKKYYTEAFFTEINGREYPVWIIEGAPVSAARSICDFDVLSDFEHSEIDRFSAEDHQFYRKFKWYEEYSRILDGTIRYPDRPGYMAKDLNLTEDGKLESFSARIGTYAENVYGTHVLEYELYRLFKTFGGCDIDDPAIWENMLKQMPSRNRFHKFTIDPRDPDFISNMKHSLTHFSPRTYSLLSVQMLVIIKSDITLEHQIFIAERSGKVAIAPSIYQLVPSGGFEILNDSDDGIYDSSELKSNFSAGCAVFREYLEELFNMEEFEGTGTGSITERLLKDRHIRDIHKLIRNGSAHLQFLGSVIDLAGLRHELSFVLVIDDESYSENRFIANEEFKKGRILEGVTVTNFEKNKDIWEKLHGPSAGMWHLFRNTSLYQKVLDDDQNL